MALLQGLFTINTPVELQGGLIRIVKWIFTVTFTGSEYLSLAKVDMNIDVAFERTDV